MLNKIDKVLTHVEHAITGSLFIASLLVLGWNIILRKVFHNASTWAEEAIRYAIIWVTFVGSSQCAKSGKHVGIDILVEALPKGMRTAEFREIAGYPQFAATEEIAQALNEQNQAILAAFGLGKE